MTDHAHASDNSAPAPGSGNGATPDSNNGTDTTTVTDPAVLEAAREWLAHDPDDATRDELSTLIQKAESGGSAATTDAADAAAELADRFSGPLTFGTAGLRGEVGAGESA